MTAPLASAVGAEAARTGLDTLDRLRRRGVRVWALMGWAVLGLLLLGDAVLHAGAASALIPVGVAINILPSLVALRGRYDAAARTLMGTLAAVLPALLVFLLRGHPWQMDGHMYFFVSMAALVMLADWRPIALATVLTAVHHSLLEWWAPDWVFNGSGDVGRVIFHVVAVGCQFGALAVVTLQLERLFTAQEEALHRAQSLTEIAEDGQRRAERAVEQARLAEAEAQRERSEREAQAARVAGERRRELVALAGQFEGSVTSIVRSIEQATDRLEQAAIQMEDVAGSSNREAEEVATGATGAASDIASVAASIRDLSDSIRTIAVAAERQSGLTRDASGEARRSVQTAAMLEEHTIQIEGFLTDIRKIAAKTNLLALNATIEAARAGDAGRGFAVVAGEVKALSADTRRASDRIGALVRSVREGVVDTATKLRAVNGAIDEVSAAATGIADAVRDQRSTAQEVDSGAERAADAASTIERRIGGVVRAAGAASLLSVAVRGSAGDLAGTARALRSSTDRFVSFLHSDDAAAA